jgi:hypothetical protein
VALAAALAFVIVERTAENPVVPFALFKDRNRLATFAAIFPAAAVFTLTVRHRPVRAGHHGLHRAASSFIPFVIA